jgi:hypothetical protein
MNFQILDFPPIIDQTRKYTEVDYAKHNTIRSIFLSFL